MIYKRYCQNHLMWFFHFVLIYYLLFTVSSPITTVEFPSLLIWPVSILSVYFNFLFFFWTATSTWLSFVYFLACVCQHHLLACPLRRTLFFNCKGSVSQFLVGVCKCSVHLSTAQWFWLAASSLLLSASRLLVSCGLQMEHVSREVTWPQKTLCSSPLTYRPCLAHQCPFHLLLFAQWVTWASDLHFADMLNSSKTFPWKLLYC